MNFKAYKDKYKEDRFYREVWVDGSYDGIFQNNTKNVVLDIGACAGEFSFFIAPHADIVYAIEPVNSQYKELEDNIHDFGFDNVKPFKLALSDKEEVVNLNNLGIRGGAHLEDTASEGTQKADAKSLAQFMKENNIEHVDILKVDIESAEGKVFNSPDFEEVSMKINMIIGEHLGGLDQQFERFGLKFDKINGGNKIFKR